MERKIIIKTIISQRQLPRLPIPPLYSTQTKLIEWIKPLVDENQYEKTKSEVDRFFSENGEANKLQEKLNEWDDKQAGSWITPFWEESYLKHRDPLPTSMNFNVLLKKESDKDSTTMIETAGEISFLVAQMYHDIIDERTDSFMEKEKRNDMSQLNRLFRSTRIPKLKRDVFYVADFDKRNNHVVLLYKNNVYKVPVTNDTGDIYNSIDITETIESAVSNETTEGVNVGIYTTAKRDEAAEVYKELKKSKVNAETLAAIADALVVISIDEKSANSEVAIKNLMVNAENKFFDKTMQIIINKYGAIGFNMEHSAIDGTSVAPVISYVTNGLKHNLPHVDYLSQTLVAKKMAWDLSEKLQEKFLQLEKDHFKRKGDFSLIPNNFVDFGAGEIKNMRISPDGFFHMALQLAQYRTFGEIKSVYEPVSVGAYYEGRTESARATSMEKSALVEAIEDGKCDEEQLYSLMQQASDAHTSRIRDCQKGHGVERHLFGLEQMYYLFGSELGIKELPKLFNDKGYKKLRHNFISTSGMYYENAQYRMFAPVVKDGHGVAYFILEDSMSINISSYSENKVKGNELMENMIKALHDLKEIAEKGRREEECINWKIS